MLLLGTHTVLWMYMESLSVFVFVFAFMFSYLYSCAWKHKRKQTRLAMTKAAQTVSQTEKFIDPQLHHDGNDFSVICIFLGPPTKKSQFHWNWATSTRSSIRVSRPLWTNSLVFSFVLNSQWKCVGVLVFVLRYYTRCCVESCVWKPVCIECAVHWWKYELRTISKRMNVTHI